MERFVSQVRVALRHQFLNSVHIYFPGTCQNACIQMTKAVQGSKVRRDTRFFLNPIDLLLDINPLISIPARENELTSGPRMCVQSGP